MANRADAQKVETQGSKEDQYCKWEDCAKREPERELENITNVWEELENVDRERRQRKEKKEKMKKRTTDTETMTDFTPTDMDAKSRFLEIPKTGMQRGGFLSLTVML